ncbi:MAG: hypothetical protein AABW49_04440 [Nanoarchaeota archaeon]
MEDIKFLRDEFEKERLEHLREILHILEEKPISNGGKFAKRFLYGLIKASERSKPTPKQVSKQIEQNVLDKRVLSPSIMDKQIKPLFQRKIVSPLMQGAVSDITPALKIVKPNIHLPEPIKPLFQRRVVSPLMHEPAKDLIPPLKMIKPLPQKNIKPNIPPKGPIKPLYTKELKKPAIRLKPEIPEAPSPNDSGLESVLDYPTQEKNTSYPIILVGNKPLASVEISGGKYNLAEPLVEQGVIAELYKSIRKDVEKNVNIVKDDSFLKPLVEKIFLKKGIVFDTEKYNSIKYYAWRDILFYGKIDPLLKDKNVKKIICDGPGKPVVVEINGKEMTTNILYNTSDELNGFLQHLGDITGKRLDQLNPEIEVVHDNIKIEATFGVGISPSRYLITKTF